MSRNYLKIFTAAAFALLLLADAPARAGSANQTFNATASVAAKCLMSSIGDLSFGAYDPVVTNASTGLSGNTSFTLTCTRSASPVISLSLANGNFGQNVAGKRSMNNGTAGAGNFLSYDLFVPSIAAQTVTIFGSVLPGQDVATGTYSDSVTATVNF